MIDLALWNINHGVFYVKRAYKEELCIYANIQDGRFYVKKTNRRKCKEKIIC